MTILTELANYYYQQEVFYMLLGFNEEDAEFEASGDYLKSLHKNN